MMLNWVRFCTTPTASTLVPLPTFVCTESNACGFVVYLTSCASFAAADGSGRRKLIRLLKHGVLMDVAKLEVFCRLNLGDVTFAVRFSAVFW